MVDKTDHDLLTEVHQALFGRPGLKGLCQQVEDHNKAINKLWIALSLVAATVGGGAFAAIKVLLGG